MKKIIFATKNEDKVKEIREIMKDVNVEILTMTQAGIFDDVVEDGLTFEANAIKKAEEIAKISGCIVMADDSGLEIDYLNKEPGVYSARYLGKDTPYKEKNQIILDRLKDAVGEERAARFICVIAMAIPGGETITTRGVMEGVIGPESRGEGGFGYDPIFFVEQYGTSTADIEPEQKNAISHRGKALREMEIQLKRVLGE